MPTIIRRAPKARINVTDEIIASAIRALSGHCMISAAIRVQIPDAEFVSTDLQTIRWSNRSKRERYVYFTPPVAQQALIKFDQGSENIKPFTFVVYQGQVVRMQDGTRHPRKREPKTLVQADNASHPNQLQVTGGKPPPLAALADGAGTGNKKPRPTEPLSADYIGKGKNTDDLMRIGRRRRWGLRALKE